MIVHNARKAVKSKCTTRPCKLHVMTQKFDDRPDYAQRLTQARQRKGIETAKEAAERYGWNVHTYIQHENGTRKYNKSAERYAAAFDVTPGWLLHGEGSIVMKKSIDLRISLLPIDEQEIYYKSFNDLLDARLKG